MRRKSTRGYWFVPRGDVPSAGSSRRMRNLDVFHDHEGFTTVWSSKSFAIMKLRSGVRIIAVYVGSRTGYARPAAAGNPGPAPRAGHSRFSAGHHGAYHKRQGRFPNPACYCKTRPKSFVMESAARASRARASPAPRTSGRVQDARAVVGDV